VAYPEDNLADDERVVMNVHPHWYALIRPVLVAAVVPALAVVGIVTVPAWPTQTIFRSMIAIVAVYLLLRSSVLPWLHWMTTRYVLTTDRLMITNGVLRRSRIDLPIDHVGEVESRSSIIEHLFGCGTLAVSSRDGRGWTQLLRMPNVRDVGSTLHRLARSAEW
jgi:uncharacterized membrane protein YdbT with pleckstrin-like domain